MRSFRPDKLIAPPLTPEAQRFLSIGAMRADVDLEIGCGVGWHPIRYAQENPSRLLVAIEQTTEKFSKFSERLTRHARLGKLLENLIPVHADAVAWVTKFIQAESLDRIILFYPNPNPKNPAARWIRMPFFGHLLTKLKPGGRVLFRTNDVAYAHELREFGTSTWKLDLTTDRMFSAQDTPVDGALTHFERKYLLAGETCFEVILTKEARHSGSGSSSLL